MATKSLGSKSAKVGSKNKCGRGRGRKPLGHGSPLLMLGKVFAAIWNWRVVLATQPLFLRITPEMAELARAGGQKSGRNCVVALALEAMFGKAYEFQVGTNYTKIWDPKEKIEVRFKTPVALARRIRHFDKTGRWDLPANVYRLAPMPPQVLTNSKNRKTKKAGSAPKVSGVFVTRRKAAKKKALPTRTVLRNARIKWACVDLLKAKSVA